MVEAIITGMVAIIVCMVNNYYQQKATKQQHDKTIALIDYKMEELTKRVDKHNNVVERMYIIEKKADVFDEKIKFVNLRIEDLEERADG